MFKVFCCLLNFLYIFYCKNINWKNLSIKILKENQNYIFGYPIYKINKNKFKYFKYEYNHVQIANHFCGILNFDTFVSFSMNLKRRNSQRVFQFLPSKNEFLCVFFFSLEILIKTCLF